MGAELIAGVTAAAGPVALVSCPQLTDAVSERVATSRPVQIVFDDSDIRITRPYRFQMPPSASLPYGKGLLGHQTTAIKACLAQFVLS